MGEVRVYRHAEWPETIHLAASGVALVLETPADALPCVIHWGADPGRRHGADLAALAHANRPPRSANVVDAPRRVSLVPESWTGWLGTPGIAGHRDTIATATACDGRDRADSAWSLRLMPRELRLEDRGTDGGSLHVHAADAEAGVQLELTVEVLPSGIVRLGCSLQNVGETPYLVDAIRLAVPVPERATLLHDLAGRWAKERVPQSAAFTVGAHVRESRHGRPGADAATLLVAASSDLDFDRGEAWGVHVAFSGNHAVAAERAFTGERLLMGGELLLPGEVRLAPGERYASPLIYAAYGVGHDGVAARFHDHLRARPRHPRAPRPVVMNVWEAVYFDHDLDRISELVDLAAEVGVERFVLDDGWFGARRDDTTSLGDWTLSEAWQDGRFGELVARVRAHEMQFGLWFEPEMVNPDSDLARTHPEWILRLPGRMPPEARHQQVLDLTHPDAYEHIRDRISTLVREYRIDFVKWDHNRDLIEAGSGRTGAPAVHEQTLAVYRMLDEIRAAHPGLEIESCASGGARIDLEILERTDRVWASDCIDARERQQIQRWTAQLIPPELVGSHVGADRAHTTNRRLDLRFRAATAVFGHFGIEWDLSSASTAEREELSAWIAYYKDVRELIHTGTVVRRDAADGALWLLGAVRPDGGEALFMITLRDRPVTWPVGPVRLPGLRRDARYVVVADGPGARDEADPKVVPAWWQDGVVLPGAMLADVGISVPALNPDSCALVRVRAVE
ncbi:alpha-galactosidase [Microbacterium sp. ASV49]|uniref:Alpha-galactosidase n=1 Tax=Microbacterium candidum TaxID=3041922 RepID=A0ABT7MWK7_9MICO|nr:alpha-galactosidase [Microbacterium sp. ASV49]MDL9978810.1 alpha-galactosidase [Microbacterium sp. ASV49]